MPIVSKDKKIKNEVAALKKMCVNIPDAKKKLAYKVCEKAAFLKVSIEECEEDIDKNGYYDKFQQSKSLDPYERTRPIVNTYLGLTSTYQKYIKQLSDLIPAQNPEASDGFDEFIGSRDK